MLIEKPRKPFPWIECVLITIFAIVGVLVIFMYLIPGFIEYHQNPLYECELTEYSSEQGMCGTSVCYVAQFDYNCENYGNVNYSSTFYKTNENPREYKDSNNFSLMDLEGNERNSFHVNRKSGAIVPDVESLTVLVLVTVFVGILFIVLGYLFWIYIISYFRNPYLPEPNVVNV